MRLIDNLSEQISKIKAVTLATGLVRNQTDKEFSLPVADNFFRLNQCVKRKEKEFTPNDKEGIIIFFTEKNINDKSRGRTIVRDAQYEMRVWVNEKKINFCSKEDIFDAISQKVYTDFNFDCVSKYIVTNCNKENKDPYYDFKLNTTQKHLTGNKHGFVVNLRLKIWMPKSQCTSVTKRDPRLC